jgi:hypothetical protein
MYMFSSAVICSLHLQIYFLQLSCVAVSFSITLLRQIRRTSFPIFWLEMWSQLVVIRL